MQFTIDPAGFRIQKNAQGEPAVLSMQDVTGIVVHLRFPNPTAFEEFQRYVADPTAAEARADARARILPPNGKGSSTGGI